MRKTAISLAGGEKEMEVSGVKKLRLEASDELCVLKELLDRSCRGVNGEAGELRVAEVEEDTLGVLDKAAGMGALDMGSVM